MFPVRQIPRFLLRFILAIGLLLAPWPGLKDGYARMLRWTGECLFGKFGSRGIVVFRASTETNDSFHDTTIHLGNRDMLKPGGRLETVTVRFSARYTGYQPTVLVLALILATPIPWRRRLWALGWGFLWVNLFVAIVTFVMILHQYGESEAIGLYQLSGFPKQLLKAAHEILVGYIGASFAVPVFIWIAVAFRREDWAGILGDNAASPEAKTGRVAPSTSAKTPPP